MAFILDFSLFLRLHIIFISKSHWLYPLNIPRIKLVFIISIFTTLIWILAEASYVLTLLPSCTLQSILSLVFRMSLLKHLDHVSPLLQTLIIKHKILTMMYKTLHNLVPSTLLISSTASCLLLCSCQTVLGVLKHVTHAASSRPLHCSLCLECSSPRYLHSSCLQFFSESPFLTNLCKIVTHTVHFQFGKLLSPL